MCFPGMCDLRYEKARRERKVWLILVNGPGSEGLVEMVMWYRKEKMGKRRKE